MNAIIAHHVIADVVYVAKWDKYRVEMQLHDHPMTVFWLSEKQMIALDKIAKVGEYSTGNHQVYIAVEQREDGSLRYIWAGLNDAGYEFLKSRFLNE